MVGPRTDHKMALISEVCVLFLSVYLGSTLAVDDVNVVIENSTPLSVQAGSNVSLVCTAHQQDISSDHVAWRDSNDQLLVYGGTLKLHSAVNKDSFGREKFSASEEDTSDPTTTRITMQLFHIRTDQSGLYSCITTSKAAGAGVVTGNASIFLQVEDAQLLVNKGITASLSCDGVDVSGVSLTSAVTWNKMGDSKKCYMPTTTSTSTSTTTPPTTPGLVTSATGGDATASSPVIDQNTTRLIARRSAERMECESPSTILIDNVQREDEGVYTCSYTYTYANGAEASYNWTTVLQVKVEPHPPGMPWQVNPDQYDTISLRWNASEETISHPVDNYTVQYIKLYSYELKQWERTDSITTSDFINKNDLQYEMKGLDQSIGYVARVFAWNEIGSTPSLENEVLKTAAYKPLQPHIYLEKSYSTTITVKWSVYNKPGDYTGFFIDFFEKEGPYRRNVTVTADPSSEHQYFHNFTDLSPYTEYCYTIQSINGNESSDPQDPCNPTKTDVNGPDAPVIVNLTTIHIGNEYAEVTVNFEPPKCIYDSKACLDSYILQYAANGTGTSKNVTFGKDSPLEPYNLSKLSLGFWYEIRMAGRVHSMIDASEFIIGNYSNSKRTELFRNTLSTTATTAQYTTLKAATTDTNKQDNTVTIVIVSVCALLVIICAVIIFVIYRKKKERGNLSIELDDDLWIDLNTPLLAPATMGYVENSYENINIDQWAEHCREMHANSDIKFTEEYESICQTANIETTWKDSLEPANMPKNRYNNIVAYDHSRVVLRTLPGVVHSDYINANYLDSYDRTRSFIATQGPLPNTIDDFWRMVWENNCSVIVMITNVYEKHKKKCEQYWPDSGTTKYGQLSVSFMGVEELAHWAIRRFTIKNNKISKKKHQIEKIIVQYHYTEWPDHGIPEYTFPVLSFVKRACASNVNPASPIVIHCSAGVGRTGTFIVLEAMMKQIKMKRTVNVQCFLRHIRSLRNHMVQTEDQYIFIHDALLHFIESGGRTDIPPKKFRGMIDELDSNFDGSGETILEKQYKTIVKWSPASHLTNSALLEVNQNKNRDLSFIPLDNSSRVKLPKVAGENGSDYINATYLHGHFLNKEFIITQHPSTKTEYDFWRMVWDQNSMTIVMLSNIGQEDLITFFRPKGETTDWTHKSSFKLTFSQENLDMLDYAVRDFLLESTQDDYEMLTRMFSITCWPEAYSEAELYSEGVFQFIEVVNQWHATKRNQTGPIIVIDKNGGKVASQFCALYTLYNQYHNDNTLDIYSLAYLYHMKRPGVWETQDDYRLLYNSMLQLCAPQEEEEKTADGNGCAKGDYAAGTFADVRRIKTIPRSPEHISRTDTL